MKRNVLVIPFLVLLNTSVYSIEISSDDEKKPFSQQAELTPDELQARIDKFKAYLTSLPIEIQQTIGELQGYKNRCIAKERYYLL